MLRHGHGNRYGVRGRPCGAVVAGHAVSRWSRSNLRSLGAPRWRWTTRNGLNFTERGFGVRAAAGSYDRGHTAVSQLKPGDFDWDEIFGKNGARWLHTGGIFCALSATTPEVAAEAMQAAKRHGTIVSYDLNYRASLWKSHGGKKQAQEVNCRIAPFVDVMIGNEEDFSAALGY